MKVLTPQEMRELDRRTIEDLGIPGRVLMESAGRGVFDVIVAEMGEALQGAKAVVLCGKGNNGGDGLVVARYLRNAGVETAVYLFGQKAQLRGDAAENLRVLEALGQEVVEVTGEPDARFILDLMTAQVLVDALFGTGFRGRIEGPAARAVELMNEAEGAVFAVDIPSGVEGGTGQVYGPAVMADFTVTMAFPKLGHLLYPGALYTGTLYVVDIGIPPDFAEGIRRAVPEPEEIRQMLPLRLGPEHKGDFGRVLTFSGSRGFTGAPSMAAMAALRIGAGLSYLGIPASLNPVFEEKLTEVITIPLPEEEGALTPEAAEAVMRWGRFDVAITGPGLSRREPALEAARRFLERFEGPAVVDADAVVGLRGHEDLLKRRHGPTVLTPHPGEFGHLVGRSPDEVNRERVGLAEAFAQEHGVFLVLKGAPTVVASPEGEVFLNPTGNPGMASGGTGDVLAGMIGGLLAQGVPPLEAAVAGVYLHGLAGDLAAEALTEHALVATDLLRFLPEALKRVLP